MRIAIAMKDSIARVLYALRRGALSLELRDIVQIAVFTAVTFVATVLLQVETPATGGYFNLGEAAIYVVAYLSKPIVAGIAAGLGPALADLATGYAIFAPATLVIKFVEGFVVSKLIRSMSAKGVTPLHAVLLIVVGLALELTILCSIAGVGLETLAASIHSVSFTIAGVRVSIPYVSLELPSVFWTVIALTILALFVAVAVVGRWRPYVLAMAVGGAIMVLGYFLYEYFVSNPLTGREPIAAIFEVPVNVGQFSVGIVISYPVVRFIEKARGAS